MDIQIVTTENNGFDIALDGPDLAADHGLRTAILISLFTDRMAEPDDSIPDGTINRRGWWANPQLGSRLWLLGREKQTTEVLRRAREYAEEALQWLMDNGIAESVAVTTEWSEQRAGVLAIGVVISDKQGGPYTDTFNYSLEA